MSKEEVKNLVESTSLILTKHNENLKAQSELLLEMQGILKQVVADQQNLKTVVKDLVRIGNLDKD